MRIKLLITIVAVLLLSGVFASADVGDYNAGSYVFHLFLDSKSQLVADRDFQISYDVTTDPFVQPSVGQFPDRGDVINLAGEVASSFKFDVHPGKLTVNAPYVSDGQKVIFYDVQNQPVLTINVSESSFCNDDGICNADRGETFLTCPKDCKQAVVSATPAPTSGGAGGIIIGVLYLVIGIGFAGGLWWFFKKRSGGTTGNITIPHNMTRQPLTPPSPLTTPPASSPPERPVSSGRAGTPSGNVDMPAPPSSNNPI